MNYLKKQTILKIKNLKKQTLLKINYMKSKYVFKIHNQSGKKNNTENELSEKQTKNNTFQFCNFLYTHRVYLEVKKTTIQNEQGTFHFGNKTVL
jgi:hypothetical protein